MASVRQICRHSKSSVLLRTRNYSRAFCLIQFIHYIVYYRQPTVASQNYNLRSKTHNGSLPKHTGHLTDSNFITRALFTNITYIDFIVFNLSFCISASAMCICSFFYKCLLNEYSILSVMRRHIFINYTYSSLPLIYRPFEGAMGNSNLKVTTK